MALKRVRMKRGSPMARGKKRMAPRSKKRIREDKEYHDVVDEIVEERGTRCQFERDGHRCASRYDDPHHILTQARSRRHSDRIDKRNIVLLCRQHHDWIELNREWALSNDWLKHGRTDEERWQ